MTDIVDSLISKVSAIIKILNGIGQLEVLDQMVDLKNTLVDVKSTNVELKNKILELKDENQKLRDELYRPPEFRNGLYYDPGQPDPYCPKCWEAERKKVHLDNRGSGYKNLTCPHCNYSFTKPPCIR